MNPVFRRLMIIAIPVGILAPFLLYMFDPTMRPAFYEQNQTIHKGMNITEIEQALHAHLPSMVVRFTSIKEEQEEYPYEINIQSPTLFSQIYKRKVNLLFDKQRRFIKGGTEVRALGSHLSWRPFGRD